MCVCACVFSIYPNKVMKCIAHWNKCYVLCVLIVYASSTTETVASVIAETLRSELVDSDRTQFSENVSQQQQVAVGTYSLAVL